MFSKTKCDLCYNHATLDFEAMRTTAQFAFNAKVNECYKLTESLARIDWDRNASEVERVMDAQRIEQVTHGLVIVSEVLATLNEAIVRDELTIVNKPEIKLCESCSEPVVNCNCSR